MNAIHVIFDFVSLSLNISLDFYLNFGIQISYRFVNNVIYIIIILLCIINTLITIAI